MFQVSSSLNGAERILVPSAHPLEDCGVKMKVNWQWVYIVPCSEVSLSLPNRFSVSEAPSKETGPFWGTLDALELEGWQRAGLYQLQGIWPDAGEEGGQTHDDFWLLLMYLSSSPTTPTTKAFLLLSPKAQLGFQETGKQCFIPDSTRFDQRCWFKLFRQRRNHTVSFSGSASFLMSGQEIQVHNPVCTNLKSRQVWTPKVFP